VSSKSRGRSSPAPGPDPEYGAGVAKRRVSNFKNSRGGDRTRNSPLGFCRPAGALQCRRPPPNNVCSLGANVIAR